MTAHTPLPWRIGGGALNVGRVTILGPDANESGWPCVCAVSGDPLGQLPQANAEFIVRACNSHEDLLEAARKAKTALFGMHEEEGWTSDDAKALELLINAIAKAEGR